MDKLKKNRGNIKARITRIKTFLDTCIATPTGDKFDIGTKIQLLEDAWGEYKNVRRSKSQMTISGIGQAESGSSRGKVNLTARSRMSDFSITTDALILTKLTSELPSAFINVKDWRSLKSMELADSTFNQPGPIDILFGADVYEDIVTEEKIVQRKGLPTARNTIFGWTFSGKVENPEQSNVKIHISTIDVSNQLSQFWELEEVGTQRNLTTEEEECEAHFKKTKARDSSGRFTVALPMKSDGNQLGVSRDMCVRRLQAVERRLERDPVHKQQYHDFMAQYINLGHMEKIPEDERKEVQCKTNYLPHHFVLKEASTTTSLRVVFDASAKTSTGVSLNDKLLVGPNIQDDMYTILMRFRLYKYVFTADIAKMYRQMKVTPEAADLQRILWRVDPSKPIEEFRLLTVTYGTASAAFLATRVLQQLALEDG